MKKGKIGLMLGLAVLLIALSGCAPSGEEVLSEQESQLSGSTISESEAPSLTAEESALLSELVSVYELKAGGKTLEEGEELDSPELLGFGVLRMYRLDEQFRDSEGGWHIPKRVLERRAACSSREISPVWIPMLPYIFPPTWTSKRFPSPYKRNQLYLRSPESGR